jgi:hypothetical protein
MSARRFRPLLIGLVIVLPICLFALLRVWPLVDLAHGLKMGLDILAALATVVGLFLACIAFKDQMSPQPRLEISWFSLPITRRDGTWSLPLLRIANRGSVEARQVELRAIPWIRKSKQSTSQLHDAFYQCMHVESSFSSDDPSWERPTDEIQRNAWRLNQPLVPGQELVCDLRLRYC